MAQSFLAKQRKQSSWLSPPEQVKMVSLTLHPISKYFAFLMSQANTIGITHTAQEILLGIKPESHTDQVRALDLSEHLVAAGTTCSFGAVQSSGQGTQEERGI